MLSASWPAYENFTASLGWGFVCDYDHYGMDPASRTDYSNATSALVGYARGVPGAYASAYNGAAAAAFLSLESCPEELLLAFFNVNYTYRLRGPQYGNMTVLEWLYASHSAGAATSASFVPQWQSLAGQVNLSTFAVGGATEESVFAAMTSLLEAAAADASGFATTMTDYFQGLVKRP